MTGWFCCDDTCCQKANLLFELATKSQDIPKAGKSTQIWKSITLCLYVCVCVCVCVPEEAILAVWPRLNMSTKTAARQNQASNPGNGRVAKPFLPMLLVRLLILRFLSLELQCSRIAPEAAASQSPDLLTNAALNSSKPGANPVVWIRVAAECASEKANEVDLAKWFDKLRWPWTADTNVLVMNLCVQSLPWWGDHKQYIILQIYI